MGTGSYALHLLQNLSQILLSLLHHLFFFKSLLGHSHQHTHTPGLLSSWKRKRKVDSTLPINLHLIPLLSSIAKLLERVSFTLCFSSSLLWTPFALKILFDIIHKHWRDFYLALTFVQFLLNECQWHTNGDELFIGLKGSQSCFYSYWKFIRRPKSTKLIMVPHRTNPAKLKGAY